MLGDGNLRADDKLLFVAAAHVIHDPRRGTDVIGVRQHLRLTFGMGEKLRLRMRRLGLRRVARGETRMDGTAAPHEM